MEDMIQKAKKKVELAYDPIKAVVRIWRGKSIDCYGTDAYRITIFVLEGSPVKGIVIANYGNNMVMAFGHYGNRLWTWRSPQPLARV